MTEQQLLEVMTEIDVRYIQSFAPTAVAGSMPPRRHALRTALLAAAVTALLATTALALSPTLRDAIASALGGFAPYAQDLTDQELTCIDQGIQVKVVSALADGNTIAIYFEARDLVGDRLDSLTKTNTQLKWPEGVEWKQGTLYPADQITYDPETKTALYCTKFIGDGAPAKNLTMQLYGQVFTPGTYQLDQPLSDETISKAVLKTETLTDGGIVLVPMQNPTSLLDGHLTLSSCGFGDDGQLHIQLCVETGKVASLLPIVHSREFLSGAKNYGEAKHYPMEQELCFDRDGMTYYDFSFQAALEDADDVAISQLMATVHDPDIKGEWRLEVPLARQRITEVSMEQSGTDVAIGPKAAKLFLSPISCTIECDPQGGKYSLGYLLTLYHSDGSVTSSIKCDSCYMSSSYATNHWTFDQPIDTETVTAIALGLWYVPIEDGVAQPGHWLSEAPIR